MNNILYSHRLKGVLQHMVCDLGLVVVLNDSRSDLDLAAHDPMIRETVERLGLKMEVEEPTGSRTITIYK